MNMPAVMFLSAEGDEQIVTPEARKMCAVWNEGLRPEMGKPAGDWRLPSAIKSLLSRTSGSGTVQVPHPDVPGLAVHIYAESAPPAGCLVTFVADSRGTQTTAQSLHKLTSSERRVAMLVTEGLRNDEIAERLNRSRRTVEFQLNAIYRKLAIGNRTQLARVIFQS